MDDAIFPFIMFADHTYSLESGLRDGKGPICCVPDRVGLRCIKALNPTSHRQDGLRLKGKFDERNK